MKKIILLLVLAVISLGLGSCGPREYTTYALADLCDTADGAQYVTINGVLKIPETVLEEDNAYGVLLVEDIDQPQPVLRIGIPVGTKNNHMQSLVDDFMLDDIVVRTNGGQIISHGAPVTISGRYRGSCIGGAYAIKVDTIESR